MKCLTGPAKCTSRCHEPPEEDRFWNAIASQMSEFNRLNQQIVTLNKEIDRVGVLNPQELVADLQQFRGDHYNVEIQAVELITNGTTFTGGDDHTACNFGRWMSSFNSTNPDINRMITAMEGPHQGNFYATPVSVKYALP